MDIISVGLQYVAADVAGALIHPDHTPPNGLTVSSDAQQCGRLAADGDTADTFGQIGVGVGQLPHGAGGGVPPVQRGLLHLGMAEGIGGVLHRGLKQSLAVLIYQAGLDAGGTYVDPQIDVLT